MPYRSLAPRAVVALLGLAFAACAHPSAPPPVPDRDTSPRAAAPSPTTSVAIAPTAAGATGEGSPPPHCNADVDCVAVEPPGCCHTGRKVAIAASQKDAYLRSSPCTEANPICPMYRVLLDERVAYCETTSHVCALQAR